MTTLVVAKLGEAYLRFFDDRFELCHLGKASVFAESEAKVLQHRLAGFGDALAGARVMLLTIIEQP